MLERPTLKSDCALGAELAERLQASPSLFASRELNADRAVAAAMVLDASVLARSIVHAGSASAWAPVFERLDAGEQIVLGVFGASVAQVKA